MSVSERIKKLVAKVKPTPKSLGSGMAAKAASAATDRNKQIAEAAADPPSYKKGGKVKKTGLALVHKGEKVLTKKQQKPGKSGKKYLA